MQGLPIEKPKNRIPFGELIPGFDVRVTDDKPPLIWVVDLIMAVTKTGPDYAKKILKRLIETQTFCLDKLSEGRFDGSGDVKLANFQNAMELMFVLPGKTAVKFRQKAADILTRYYAGDASLVSEIQANAVSDSPINQMAREALGKRKAEIEDLELAERRIALKEREAALESNKIAVESDKIAMESKKMHAPLEFLKACSSVVDSWEDRDKVKIRAMIMNHADTYFRNTNGNMLAIEPGELVQSIPKFTSITEVANEMGERNFSNNDLMGIGKLASKLYQEQYGVIPNKHRVRLANGQDVDVCDYQDIHVPLIQRAIFEYKADLLKKAKQSRAQPSVGGYFSKVRTVD